MSESTTTAPQTSLDQLDQYWRAANYLAAAQIYLRDNVLLRESLQPEHIKPRLLGHWGTVPGINFIYAHLNRLIVQEDRPVLLVTGPGHGAPANLANLFLEGSLGEHYPEFSRDPGGLKRLVQSFSWPGGFPSHLTPATPGAIHEGGELGYALATAFGAALDNPDLIVACIVGDGEAETGPTATAWHLTKYLNPQRDGAVLPILHLNDYKIASRTIMGSMNRDELRDLFVGYGYEPLFVEVTGGASSEGVGHHQQMRAAMDKAYQRIEEIQTSYRRRGDSMPRPRWPLILLRSPKGWTVVDELDGKPIEGSYRAHQVPISKPRENPQHLKALERWLRSYSIEQLFDPSGHVVGDWIECAPHGDRRMGMVPHANGGVLRKPLDLQDWKSYGVRIDRERRGEVVSGDTKVGGELLRDVIAANRDRYRVFCPDELDSNRLSAIFESTQRQFLWPVGDADDDIGPSGEAIEVLSEHTCQALLQGYLLTGRHGIFPCYEAFVSIVDSMMGQYAKFLKQIDQVSWRRPVSSFNYLLSSEGWRQDHNGYSHQMPGFINMLLNKKAQNVRVYLPPDTSCLLSTLHHCLDSTNKINLIIASKQPMPQWLTVEEAETHCRDGISIWKWASTHDGEDPDVTLACAGVYPTAEAVVAAWHLKTQLPELRLRLVNVTDLLILELQTHHPHGLTEERFAEFFTHERPVVFNFHGYPSAVKQLLWNRPNHDRFQINGYIEEGTTTTPFRLLADNRIDRFTLVDQVLGAASQQCPELGARAEALRQHFSQRRDECIAYGERHGEDPAEIQRWTLEDVERVS